jgi:hypothetical protein
LDVAQRTEMVEAELTRLIEKRSRNGAQDPDEQDALWKASVKAYHERRRRQNAAAWFAFFCRQAEAHRKLSESYEVRAEVLCEEGGARGRGRSRWEFAPV